MYGQGYWFMRLVFDTNITANQVSVFSLLNEGRGAEVQYNYQPCTHFMKKPCHAPIAESV
jgi:hypothetical protein